MKKACLVLFTLFLVFGLMQTAGATYITEVEGNDTFATAQDLDAYFSLDSDPDIYMSETYQHASVDALLSSIFDVDYYAFTVTEAGMTGYFDIDYVGLTGFFDSIITLFDSSYNVLAVGDDSYFDPGSITGYDGFIGDYAFTNPGTYYLEVSSLDGNFWDPGDYVLHASLSPAPAPVPEPATMILLGSGIIGLAGFRRKFRKK